MKRWVIGAVLTASMLGTAPTALASDNLWSHHHHVNTAHATLYPIRADFGSVDAEPGHRPDIKSSVQVSRDALREAFKASEDAYTQKLKRYALCSPRDAEKAVQTAHPGMKIQKLQLRNIRTSLVYLAIAQDEDDKYLVVVDAGNAKVLMDRPLPTHQEKAFAQH